MMPVDADQPPTAKDQSSRRGLGWKFCTKIAFSMLCSLGVIGYLEWKDVSSRKFVPKRILLDAQNNQDHANLIFDVDADAMPKSVSLRDMGCMIKMPCKKQDTCTVLNAHYDGLLESNEFDASTVRLQMRLIHGGLKLKRIKRAIKRKNLGIADIKVECDATLAYMRLHPIVAPEFTTTYASSLKEVVENMKPLSGWDVERPVTGKKMPDLAPRSMRWYFERTSRVRPRLRKLSMHGSVEGNAKLYIPPGRLAQNIHKILTDIPVYVQADVSYWETSRKAFHAGVSARGRIGAKRNRWGAVTLKMPVTTNTSMGLPVVSMMAKAYQRPEDRVISVASEPRSFFGHVLGSTKTLAVSDQITATEGITWSELASIARRDGGRGLQEMSTMSRGVWSASFSLVITEDEDSSANITAYVIGGTPLTMGFTFKAKSVEERHEERDRLEEIDPGQSQAMRYTYGYDEWEEDSLVGVGIHASYNDDTKDWSGDMFLNVTSVETGDAVTGRADDHSDTRLHLNWMYTAKKMTAAITLGLMEDSVDWWDEGSQQWERENSDSTHKINIAVEFEDDFPAWPKDASIVLDVDADEMPLTTLTYKQLDTSGVVEKHQLKVVQASGELQEEAVRVNPGQVWTNFAVGGDRKAYAMGTELLKDNEVYFITDMSMTVDITVDKTSTSKWKVSGTLSADGSCKLDKTRVPAVVESQWSSTDYPANMFANLQADGGVKCGECESEEDHIHPHQGSCMSLVSGHLKESWADRPDVSMDRTYQGNQECCHVQGVGGDTSPYEEKSCCESNPMMGMYDDMFDSGLGHTQTETFDFEMDPIETDSNEDIAIGGSEEEDFPDIKASFKETDGLWTASLSVVQENVEEVSMLFNFRHLNDMKLGVYANEGFMLNASGTAPDKQGYDGFILAGRIIDDEEDQVVKLDFYSDWKKEVVSITEDGAVQLLNGGDGNLLIQVYDEDNTKVFEETGSMTTTSDATKNEIKADFVVEVDGVKEADITATINGASPFTSYTMTASLVNKENDKWEATGTMNRVGDWFAGDIMGTDNNGESEHITTAFTAGFFPMQSKANFDRWDMNVSLGQRDEMGRGSGIEDVALDFGVYFERGPKPIRALANMGMSLTGFEIMEPTNAHEQRVKISAELGMPYDIEVDLTSTVGEVTAYENELEMDDTSLFSEAAYIKSAAAASGIEEDQVTIDKVEHQTEVGYDFPGTVTQDQAETAVAATANVPKEKVEATANRRLSDSNVDGRRLVTSSFIVTITVDDASTLDSVVTKVQDTTQLQTHLGNAGATVTAVTVSQAPKKKVKVTVKLVSDAGTPAVPPPSQAALSQRLTTEIGTAVTAIVEAGSVQQGQTVQVSRRTTTTASPTGAGGPGAPTGGPGGGAGDNTTTGPAGSTSEALDAGLASGSSARVVAICVLIMALFSA